MEQFLVFCLCLGAARAISWPAPFPNRREVPATDSGIQTGLYDSPEWSKSWYGQLPDTLKNGPHDEGFNATRRFVVAQSAFAVDIVLRQHEGRENLSVLDVGAGAGYMGIALSAVPGWHVTLLDQSPAALREAAEWLRMHGSAQQKERTLFKHSKIEDLAVEDSSVDVVVAFHVLHEVPNLKAALQKVHRVLKPDGLFVFSVRNRNMASWVASMWHTEWQRDIPKELVDWRLGVTPEEMKVIADEVGFNMVHEELVGLCDSAHVTVDWGKAPWILQYKTDGAAGCKDLSKVYMGWAYMHPVEEGCEGDADDASSGRAGEL